MLFTFIMIFARFRVINTCNVKFNRRDSVLKQNRKYLRLDCPYHKKKIPFDGNVTLGFIFLYQKLTSKGQLKSVFQRVCTLLVRVSSKYVKAVRHVGNADAFYTRLHSSIVKKQSDIHDF